MEIYWAFVGGPRNGDSSWRSSGSRRLGTTVELIFAATWAGLGTRGGFGQRAQGELFLILCMRGPTVVCTVGVIVGMTGEPKVKLVVGLTCGGCDQASGWDCGQADGWKDDGGSGVGMVTEATLVQRLR